MSTVSPHAPKGKPHYVYVLAYPESMGGHVFYVGKGSGVRIHDHEMEARNGKTANRYKTGTINKIWDAGEQVVKKKLAFFETHEDALLYEIALIFFMDGLTNLTDGGDGSRGLKFSEEARQKMSKRMKGRVVPEETRQRISYTLQGHTHSEETRQKISQRQIGKKGISPSPEVRQRISRTLQGHTVSEESRQKMSKRLKGKPATNKGLHLSEEHRRKISEGNKGK